MTFTQFLTSIRHSTAPVILLEGTRQLPDVDRPQLTALARHLAEVLPHARFRTGNAEGTDEAFAEGINEIDPKRLEYMLPYLTMRRRQRHPAAPYVALEMLNAEAEAMLTTVTAAASPQHARLLARRSLSGAVDAKARYLLRDTLKVIGSPEHRLAPATFGLFYVNPTDPSGGGTGHTMRVCQHQGVPFLTQQEWQRWLVARN